MAAHSHKAQHIRRKLLLNIAACSSGAVLIALIAWLAEQSNLPLLIPPFGATCFIIFLLPESAFARSYNIIGGHLFSASVGLLCLFMFGSAWWVSGLGVGLSMLVMRLSKTMHPPAAGTPLFVLMHPAVPWPALLLPITLSGIILAFCAQSYRRLSRYLPQK